MRSKEFKEGWDYYNTAEDPKLADNPYNPYYSNDGNVQYYDWRDGFVCAEEE